MGDEATTGVETETGDAAADTGSTETVLTDTGDTGAADAGSTETNLDASGNPVADGDAKLDADGNPIVDGDADAGAEGSDVVPDTYADFTMPEGVEFDEVALTEVTPLLKEVKATQEQAQKFADWYASKVQAGSQKQVDNFNQLMNDWREQSKNDGEFGGDKYDENVKIAQSAINKYGTSELKQLLNDHGVGNHPELVRFMVRVGRTLNEDVPGSTGNTSTQAEDAVSILYPND